MFDKDGFENPTIIALWAYPRTLSTPFERIFIERGDAQVCHEPFFNAFYYSNDRGSRRELPSPLDNEKNEQNYKFILEKLLCPCSQKIRFIKDMAFYSYPYLRVHHPEFYSKIINTFIIRKPKEALLSHFKISPDLESYPEETGFAELYDLFQYVTKTLGQRAIVVDADQLANHPDEVLEKYCRSVDIPHYPQSLKWQPGKKINDWQDWADWHVEVEKSAGIYSIALEKLDQPIPAWLLKLIQSSNKVYDEMFQYALLDDKNSVFPL